MSIETTRALPYEPSSSDQLRHRDVMGFTEQHKQLVATVRCNMEIALGRFGLSEETRVQTATELTYLWTQAKVAQRYADQQKSNPISGFNVGVGMGVHLQDKDTGETYFWDAAGANREPHPVPIAAAHGETSAIEVLRNKLAPILAPGGQDFKVDLVALTATTPCGSCREEIYTNRSSDNTLVAVVDDGGNVSINTIAELFPIQFEETDSSGFDHIISQVRSRAAHSILSRCQKEDVLPFYGVVFVLDNISFTDAYGIGDDAFLSGTATIQAVNDLLLWGRFFYTQEHSLTPEQIASFNWQEVDNHTLSLVTNVIFVYSGPSLPYYPSGIDRQQLVRLEVDVPVLIIEATKGKVWKTTRGALLPGAFTKETPIT